jgi:hypothetical protein
MFAPVQIFRLLSVFDPWLFLQAINRRGHGEAQRRRVSLRSSANSAVQSENRLLVDETSSGAHSFVPSGSGDFLVRHFLVILRLRPVAALGSSWFFLVRFRIPGQEDFGQEDCLLPRPHPTSSQFPLRLCAFA